MIEPSESAQQKTNWRFLVSLFAIIIALYVLGTWLQYNAEKQKYDQLMVRFEKQKADERKALGEKLDAYSTPIIQALNRYKDEKGKYPENLAALVPEYLSNEPYAAFGEKLYYSVDNYDGLPFYFAFYGHYDGLSSMHGWYYVYCPSPNYDITGEGVYRINKNWMLVHSSSL